MTNSRLARVHSGRIQTLPDGRGGPGFQTDRAQSTAALRDVAAADATTIPKEPEASQKRPKP